MTEDLRIVIVVDTARLGSAEVPDEDGVAVRTYAAANQLRRFRDELLAAGAKEVRLHDGDLASAPEAPFYVWFTDESTLAEQTADAAVKARSARAIVETGVKRITRTPQEHALLGAFDHLTFENWLESAMPPESGLAVKRSVAAGWGLPTSALRQTPDFELVGLVEQRLPVLLVEYFKRL